VNIQEKNEKDQKNEKFDKQDKNEKKNYLKIFNIDKKETVNITNLEKLNINPIMMKHVNINISDNSS